VQVLKDEELLTAFGIMTACFLQAQEPKAGRYVYTVLSTEWAGKSLGASRTVLVRRGSAYIINNGALSGKRAKSLIKAYK
jgi:hypothetical protein